MAKGDKFLDVVNSSAATTSSWIKRILLLLHLMSIDFLSFATQRAGDFAPRIGVHDDLTKAKAAFAGWFHGQKGMSPPSSSGMAALPVSWRFGAS